MGFTEQRTIEHRSSGLLGLLVMLLALLVAAYGFWFDTHANVNGVRGVPYLMLIFAAALTDKAVTSFHMAILASALLVTSVILVPPLLSAELMLRQTVMSVAIIWLPALTSLLQRSRFSRLDEKLYEVAKLDRLTRLHNRHYLLDELDKAIQRWRRGHMQFSVMVVDIDGLARINDHYGEQLGDEVLAYTAKVLRASCRDLDYLGRLGADRFLLILPATDATQAKILATRVQDQLAEAALKSAQDEAVSISVSIGIVDFQNGRWTAEDTLAAADAALELSRADGFGKISCYESDQAPVRQKASDGSIAA